MTKFQHFLVTVWEILEKCSTPLDLFEHQKIGETFQKHNSEGIKSSYKNSVIDEIGCSFCKNQDCEVSKFKVPVLNC